MELYIRGVSCCHSSSVFQNRKETTSSEKSMKESKKAIMEQKCLHTRQFGQVSTGPTWVETRQHWSRIVTSASASPILLNNLLKTWVQYLYLGFSYNGGRYSGTIASEEREYEVCGCCCRLFHPASKNGSLSEYHSQGCRAILVEECHMLIWYPPCVCHGQRQAVWLRFILRVVCQAPCKELLLVSKTPPGEWTSGGH